MVSLVLDHVSDALDTVSGFGLLSTSSGKPSWVVGGELSPAHSGLRHSLVTPAMRRRATRLLVVAISSPLVVMTVGDQA